MSHPIPYLQQHPSGIYYFRIAIPRALKSILGQRELKQSLRTRNPVVAQRTAQVLALEAEHLFRRIENHYMPKKPNNELGLTIARLCRKPDGTTEMEGIELDPDKGEEELRLFRALTQDPGHATPDIKAKDSTVLEDVIEKYCEEKVREGSWTDKTEHENRAIYTLLTKILGNPPLSDISAVMARDYKQVLMKLPPNLNKSALYRSKSIEQVMDMKPEKTMAINTINKNITRTSSLFTWALRHGYVDKNYFDGLTLKSKKRSDEERAAYSRDDLKEIFRHKIYTTHSYKHPYQYWLPLLSLYTGARIEELCQLLISDVSQDEDTWVIRINDEGDKKLKTKSSKRIIPIHPKLQELGFVEYIQQLSSKKVTRLFPELSKDRDGYSQAASKWFGRFRQQFTFSKQIPAKVFHSFRHTFITELKHLSVPEQETAAITGHRLSGITYGRYGKEYTTKKLSTVINNLDFDAELQDVKPYV